MSYPVILGVVIAAATVAGVGDAYTTQLGFDAGLTEGNPVAKWLQAKLGLALSTFLVLALFIFSAGVMSVYQPPLAMIYAAGILALETTMVIRNSILIKQRKALPAIAKK